ncbi:hypothetical protein CP061683_0842A, partial [Chlamydia psittaci 06-1683]
MRMISLTPIFNNKRNSLII